MGWTDQSVIKEGLVEVAKIKTVLAEIGFHMIFIGYIVDTI